jgi:cell wall-associated NlpC family hydrolase
MGLIAGIVSASLKLSATVVPMLKRFAPLVPLALVTLLFGCAAHTPVSQQAQQQQVQDTVTASSVRYQDSLFQDEVATEKELAAFADGKSYQLPVLADSILERGMSLIGTRYRFGGTSEAGFDCSGFIGYLFRAAGVSQQT